MADLRFNNGLRRWLPAALLLAGILGASPAAWARRNGIDTAGCDGCHNGGRPTTVSLTASSLNPPLGQPVTLTITVSNTNGPVAGFYLTTDDVNRGTFRTVESGTLANAYGVLHTTPRAGAGGVSTFKVEWSAPVATGVNFAAYALSANGDASARGDGAGSASLGVVTGCAGATFYMDQDGDGVGTSDTAYPTRRDCTKPLGFAPVSGDCNDFNAKIFPGAVEQCDAKDNNCDGKIDESIVYQMYCEDKDGDGHGVIGAATKSDCAPSVGFGDCKGDCNDASAVVRPGGTEVCDNRDNNCDGRVDEGVRMTCGVGWCRRYAEGCTSMCTPGSPMAEQCNSFDDDCDGMIDDGTDAELCGTSGMVCVLGRCIAGDGGGAGNGGGSPSGSGGAGMSGGSGSGGGAGAVSGGGASGGGGPGAANGGTGASAGAGGAAAGGAAAGEGGGGGCAVAQASPSAGLATCMLFAALAVLMQSGARRRRVFPRAGLRARTCACQKSRVRFSPSPTRQG